MVVNKAAAEILTHRRLSLQYEGFVLLLVAVSCWAISIHGHEMVTSAELLIICCRPRSQTVDFFKCKCVFGAISNEFICIDKCVSTLFLHVIIRITVYDVYSMAVSGGLLPTNSYPAFCYLIYKDLSMSPVSYESYRILTCLLTFFTMSHIVIYLYEMS
jgi:hypothetical protein